MEELNGPNVNYPDGTIGNSIGRIDFGGEGFVIYARLNRAVTEEWVTGNFPGEHCQHTHDCCGHWYARTGTLVETDDVYDTSVVSQVYIQNV